MRGQRSSHVLGFAALALAVGWLGGCAEQGNEFLAGEMDLAVSFHSMNEMLAYEGGPLVVVAQVVSRDRPNPAADATPASDRGITHSTVVVEEVVLNAGTTEAGDSLAVRQSGTPTREFRNARLLKVGDRVLLFLTDAGTPGESYTIAGGAFGYYIIEGEELHHPNLEREHPLVQFVQDLTLEEVLAKIRSVDDPA